MRLKFGTDGVRGPVGQEINTELFRNVGGAVADLHGGEIIVGWDGRESGTGLGYALSAGAAERGAEVSVVGMAPTPVISWCASRYKAWGVSVTASHNLFKDNGLKLFLATGEKLSDESQSQIQDIVQLAEADRGKETSDRPWGAVRQLPGYVDDYIDWLVGSYQAQGAEALRIAVDCGNGAFSDIAPEVLSRLGAEVIEVNCEPDGRNINVDCGAVKTSGLAKVVLSKKCDVGLAFDGDGDRLVVVDRHGATYDGDNLVLLLATSSRPSERIVVTEWSNLGLFQALAACGVPFSVCAVGDRNVRNEMNKGGAKIGAEQSGHIIMLDRGATGDGLLSALEVIRVASDDGVFDLSGAKFRRAEQPQSTVKVRKGTQVAVADKLKAIAERYVGDEDLAVSVRPSGTEPMVRIMVQSFDPAKAQRVEAELKEECHKLVRLVDLV